MANVHEPSICAACGRRLPEQQGRGRQKQYCDATCRSAARRSRSRTTNEQHVNERLTNSVRKVNLDNVTEVVDQVLAAAERFSRDWAEPDPLVAVASARQLAGAVDDALRAAVDRARQAGRTWQEVGDLLGTSRQAAFQRFGRQLDPRTGEPMPQELLSGATERAVAVLIDYTEGRYDEVRRDFDEAMLAEVTIERLTVGWAHVSATIGAYEGMGDPFTRALGGLTVVDVPLRFEAGDLVGRISFRANGKIAGMLVTRPQFA